MGVSPLKFPGDLWQPNTRVSRLSYGDVCMILHLSVLTEHCPVTNRLTD